MFRINKVSGIVKLYKDNEGLTSLAESLSIVKRDLGLCEECTTDNLLVDKLLIPNAEAVKAFVWSEDRYTIRFLPDFYQFVDIVLEEGAYVVRKVSIYKDDIRSEFMEDTRVLAKLFDEYRFVPVYKQLPNIYYFKTLKKALKYVKRLFKEFNNVWDNKAYR